MVTSIRNTVEDIESRLERLEKATSAILERLQLPSLDSQQFAKTAHIPRKPPQIQPPESPAPARRSGPYTYKPLDASKSEIRLLCLSHSTAETDTVEAGLLHVGLDAKPSPSDRDPVMRATYTALTSFHALSYTWGEPKADAVIRIEGHDFHVTKNLESALRMMRNVTISRSSPQRVAAVGQQIKTYWWIDQICINQSDIDERNSQVALMRRIYKKASIVNIWLGDEADDSNLAMKVLVDIGKVHKRAPGEKDDEYPHHDAKQKECNWNALYALLRRPWWQRSWIRQEVALARRTTLHCGEQSCELNVVFSGVDALNYVEGSLGFEAPYKDRSSSVYDGAIWLPHYRHAGLLSRLLRDTNRGNSFTNLTGLLLHTRFCKATDPHDKVFSMLGLVDPDECNLRADYRAEVRHVFMSAAKAVLMKEGGLHILAASQNPERTNGPSWMPNLLEDWKAEPFQPGLSRSTGGSTSGCVKFDGDTLLVKGHTFDSIATISPAFVRQDSTSEDLDEIYSAWQGLVSELLNDGKVAANISRILENDLTGLYAKDRNWVYFLSAGTYPSQSSPMSREGDFLPLSENDLRKEKDTMDFKLVQAYFLPEDFYRNVHPKRNIRAVMRKFGPGRRLAITRTGAPVWVPADTKVGDVVAQFQSALFAYIMREEKNAGEYGLVGEAYVPKYFLTDYFVDDGYLRII